MEPLPASAVIKRFQSHHVAASLQPMVVLSDTMKGSTCRDHVIVREPMHAFDNILTTTPDMAPEDIPLGYWTHINFAFAFINPTTFELAPMSNEVGSPLRSVRSRAYREYRSRHYTNVSRLSNRNRTAYRSGLVSVAGHLMIQAQRNTLFRTLRVQVLRRPLSSNH